MILSIKTSAGLGASRAAERRAASLRACAMDAADYARWLYTLFTLLRADLVSPMHTHKPRAHLSLEPRTPSADLLNACYLHISSLTSPERKYIPPRAGSARELRPPRSLYEATKRKLVSVAPTNTTCS